jgi:CRISPR-associated endonuclease Csn1
LCIRILNRLTDAHYLVGVYNLNKPMKEVNDMGYSVGLDIGTGSVGWAVIGDDYKLKRAKGKNLVGVRLFDSASTAEERRGYRTTRRRLSRRRWRLRLLNEIFAPELAKVDENFLARLKYSWVNPNDEQNLKAFQKDAQGFNGAAVFGTPAADQEFYAAYPTIYHLRKALMDDDKQHDLREVYLALHHIVKYRGHFLIDGDVNPEATFDVAQFCGALTEFAEAWADDETRFGKIDATLFMNEIINSKTSKSERVEKALAAISDNKADKQLKAILTALVGNQANLINIFEKNAKEIEKDDQKRLKFNFGDATIDEKLADVEALLEPAEYEFVLALKVAYDGLTLKMLLGDDKSVSAAMVRRYEEHKADWAFIKKYIRTKDNAGAGTYKQDGKIEGINSAYLALQSDDDDVRKSAKTVFVKAIEGANISLSDKTRLLNNLLNKIEEDTFLPRQRTKANGTIPHQLHLAELVKIIQQQSKYYPFLAEVDQNNVNKLAGLVNFRVPYYVGPLVSQTVTEAQYDGLDKNHWMTRLSDEEITPWNFDDVVDKDKSAADFIKRLTGTDTYLIGEPTLPQNSLLYQKYNVLQELNNVRLSGASGNVYDDKRRPRLTVAEKQDIFEHVFKVSSKVSAKQVEDYLAQNSQGRYKLSGLAGVDKFNNGLTSYVYLSKTLGAKKVDAQSIDDLEKIIEFQTVFEDKTVLRRQLNNIEWLTDAERDKLANKHFTGWGRLSKKFLTAKSMTIKLADDINPASHSLMDALYGSEKNLMELLANNTDEYGFYNWVEEQNRADGEASSTYTMIDELAGPKDIKRGITQTFRILDDIKKALGEAPERVYLEFARETQQSRRTDPRRKRLDDLYSNAGLKELMQRISQGHEYDNTALQSDRIYLYFVQQGKDMYTGQELDINNLSNYDIDHIIPQAYTKDNSLDNIVLVNSKDNRMKSDSDVFLTKIDGEVKKWWKQLYDASFISKTKYKSLTQTQFKMSHPERFIARSLVETRQIIKNVASLINSHFDGQTKAEAIRANLTGDMRSYINIKKNRDINDYHHAHDALLVATVGEFIEKRGFMSGGKVSDNTTNEYNVYVKQWIDKARANTDYERVNPFGFVVGAMKSATMGGQSIKVTNKETGEIVWTQDDFDYLLKVLDYKKMLVTRRVKDQTGQLYNESRYGAKLMAGKKTGLVFDKNKSIELYGGFDSAKPAYAALIKEGKKYKLVNVLRSWVHQAQDEGKLLARIQENYPKAELILSHVPYGQLVTKDGAKVTVSSATELHNFEQLWLERETYNLINALLNTSEEKIQAKLEKEFSTDDETLAFERAFDEIISQAGQRYPLHVNALDKVRLNKDVFMGLAYADKQQTLQRILQGLHANATSADLKKMKASGEFGRLKLKWSPSDDDEFIFQSPSGIFETRKTVKELYERSKNV